MSTDDPTRRQVVAGLLCAAAVGCGPTPVAREAPGTHDLEDRIHGKKRRSKLVVPPGLEGLAPMVMGLHGTGDDPAGLMGRGGWEELCTQRGWVGVFPAYERGDCKDDNVYLGHLLLRAQALGGVDPRRVYVFGHGAGGRRAYALACKNGSLLAAVGAVSAPVRFVQTDLGFQDPEGPPMSVLHVHGGQDERFPAAGGVIRCGDRKTRTVVPVDEALKPWVDQIGGTTSPAALEVPDGLDVAAWSGGGRSVVRVLDPLADHAWPGAATSLLTAFFVAAPPRDGA
jgi:polyhydroxybutyrate depolymerase